MTRLIVDMSPILYSNFIGASNYIKKDPMYKGIYELKDNKIPLFYKDIVLYNIFSEISILKSKFGADEVIYAFDNSSGSYWRKDFYDRYKYGRKEGREESDLSWDEAFGLFNEIQEVLDKYASGKVISIPRLEADDISFVLCEYFNNDEDITVLYSIDKDWIHNLVYLNVRFFRSRKTQGLEPIEEIYSKEQLKEKVLSHCINGDPGDGFLHIKSWSQFSDEFLEMYPNLKGKELKFYDKHHEIEKKFYKKTGKNAYKHPRFGYKMMVKSKKSLKDVLNENPIYKKNFFRNKKLCLPSGIPETYKKQIIEAYNNANSKPDYRKLQEYIMKYNLFDLISVISMI